MNAATTREGFGSREMQTTGETQQTALAAAAQAKVNARFIMAMQRPRNWDDVRVRILKECERPGFAEVARYNKPIGKGVRGPSIRFAEACLRYAQNFDAPVSTVFEDRYKRIVHAEVIDLESNASYGTDITIDKTVERSELKDRVMIAQRKNSKGQPVFIVEATEDELLNKQNALVSKALRTEILRFIPGDIVEEGQQRCIETLKSRAKKDPAGEKKRILDAFAEIGVMPKDVADFVGHPLEALQPAELVELREVYATVRDGETTWKAVIEARRPTSAKADGEGEAKPPTTTADLEARLREQAAAADPRKDEAAPEPKPRDWDAEGVSFVDELTKAHGLALEDARSRFKAWAKDAPAKVVESVEQLVALANEKKDHQKGKTR